MPSRHGSGSKAAQSKSVLSNSDVQSGIVAPVVVVELCEDAEITESGRACRTCRGLDTNDMVQCDLCDRWHHFSCVGVTQDVANVSWSCPKCAAATGVQQVQPCPSKEAGRPSSAVENPENLLPIPEVQTPRTSRRNKAASEVTEARSNTSSILKLKLLRLEEERVLEEQEAERRRLRLEEEKAFEEEEAQKRRMQLEKEKVFEEKEARKRREYLQKKYQLLEQMSSNSDSRCSSSASRIGDWVNDVNQLRKEGEPSKQPTVEFQPAANSTNHILRCCEPAVHHKQNNEQQSLPASKVEAVVNHQPDVQPALSKCIKVPVSFRADDPSHHHCPSSCRATLNPTSSRAGPSVQREPETLCSQVDRSTVRSHHAPVSGMPTQCVAVHAPNKQQLVARQGVPRDLPVFSGKPEEWPIFVSAFHRTTALCGFSNDENIVRLQKCLKDKAYDTVKCLLLHPANVPSIIETLKLLFGQPEAIIHAMVLKINSLATVREDRFETLVEFAVSVRNFCSTIEACDMEDYMYNITLLHQLVDKLPPSIKLEWARYRRPLTRVNLATFGNWIYGLAQDASTLTVPSLIQNAKSRNESRHPRRANMFLHSQAEEAAESSKPTEVFHSQSSVLCPVCKGKCREVSKCQRFRELSRDSRWAVVREYGLCRRCLRKHTIRCNSKPCGKDGCPFYHHELLHNNRKPSNTTMRPANAQSTTTPEPSSSQGCNTHQTATNAVLFRYLPVMLHGPTCSISAFAFLDEGSAVTLMDEDLANELNLDGTPCPLKLRWTAGTERNEKESRIVNLKIAGVQPGAKPLPLNGVRTVKQLLLPYQSLNVEELSKRHAHLCNLPISSYTDVRPRILIGMKHASVGIVLKSKEGNYDQPIAVKTRLGWTICGGSADDSFNLVHYAFHVCECDCQSEKQFDEDIHKSMKDYFALDSLGVSKPSSALLSTEDQRAIDLLKQHTRFNGKRYETALLWRYDDIRLPDNKSLALRRYHQLEKRMQNDPKLQVVLKQTMLAYVAKGYARRLSSEELVQQYPRTWFLPIFPVTNPNKPGKVRIVWDAAAKAAGISLNSALVKGPDQLCSLFSILLKFREGPIGITGDIREMFHQVLIRETDQQCQRFLWRDESGEIHVYVMNVMTFGASCSPSCAQYILNMNAQKFNDRYPEAVSIIQKQHYVDDAMFSTETAQQAIQLARDIRHIHSAGGFEIRNWITNSKTVLEAMEENSVAEKNLDLSAEISTDKVLGMW